MFYDSSKPLQADKFRSDITTLGVPLTRICNETYTDSRQRQLFKNIIYVGALAALLNMQLDTVISLLGEQFKGKEKLLDSNVHALTMGYEYAQTHFDCPINLTIKASDAVGDKIFLEGNRAAALGAVYGGATVAAWYPITPSSSLAEAFAAHCKRFRHDETTGKANYAILQAEDELASIGMVIGAAWNGARAFTATSGPGISLMQEFIGFAYFAEIPAVIFDVQRGGPSTGMPTRTQQSDITLCAYSSHGDTKHVLLFPEDPKEAFEMGAAAFDLSDRLQTPIFVMLDLDIGMNDRLCEPLEWDEERQYDRGKVMTAEMLEQGIEFGRYLDVDDDGIPYRTYPGTHPTKGVYFTRGTTKDQYAKYSEAGDDYVENMERLARKFATASRLVPAAVIDKNAIDDSLGIIYYGSTAPAMAESFHQLKLNGVSANGLRIRAFPFGTEVAEFIATHEQVIIVEQNSTGQLRSLLINELEINPAKLLPALHYDGTPITASFITDAVMALTSTRKDAESNAAQAARRTRAS